MEDHPKIWAKHDQWFDKLDEWVTRHVEPEREPNAKEVFQWRRSCQTSFDLRSPAYQDMVFFHPFIRRAFFDTAATTGKHDALVHSYSLESPSGSRLFYIAEDIGGSSAEVEVTSVRLLLFGNGISILTIGIEAHDLSFGHALWINEMMRKIYPSSDRQLESGRIPNRMALVQEESGRRNTLIEEGFENSRLIALRPQLSRILLGLLQFASYRQQEFEPVLDERMIVNTFVKLDGRQLPDGYEFSEEYEVAFSRLLYVDREGPGYRYETHFIREEMRKQVYRRWQHQGTLYGFTSYSNVTSTIALPERAGANALVYRMFNSKNHLIALIALFYRATLLDFARESALVSRQLFPIFSGQVVRHKHIQFATKLMADFHYFNNYWFFDELTTKDEELEHFQLFCSAYRISELKESLGDQIGKLAGYIDRLYALRNSDAVNRLAMLSVILGIGALVTGFYGMNIPHLQKLLGNDLLSIVSFAVTLLMTAGSVCFIVYIVGSNWVDFRASLLPHRYRKTLRPNSLRRLGDAELLEDDEQGALFQHRSSDGS